MRVLLIATCAASVVATAACGPAPVPAVTPRPQALCWQSIAPDTGAQDRSLAFMTPSLAAAGGGEAWLAWDHKQPHVRRWAGGAWTPTPPLERKGVDGLWSPKVTMSPSGRAYVVAAANIGHGISALHVARANGASWEWLGAPLVSSSVPFTHVNAWNITFAGGDVPIVAWSEAPEEGPVGLFVARWDGTTWKRLGHLDPQVEDPFFIPAVAVDAQQRVWLAWSDAHDSIRVRRWQDARWDDVDAASLQAVMLSQGGTQAREVSLAIDAQGHAWVLRSVAVVPTGMRLGLARWNGRRWAGVEGPAGPPGKATTVWAASMVLRGDAPVIAWSQADATDNHYLFVSEWSVSGWIPRLTSLHLAEGISNVHDIALAAGDARTLFVAWDEPGSDERRTRLARAYPCAEGETPAATPHSVVERDTWPLTVDAAARQIVAALDDESKARVRGTPKDQLIQFHLGWGMGIRNSLGLWRGNDALLESCGRGSRVHPDECSTVIIEAVWELLQFEKGPG